MKTFKFVLSGLFVGVGVFASAVVGNYLTESTNLLESEKKLTLHSKEVEKLPNLKSDDFSKNSNLQQQQKDIIEGFILSEKLIENKKIDDNNINFVV
jgi:hypothetical protein